MTLSNIRTLGRYKNTETGKEFNVKKGRVKGRSTDVYFYLYMGKRQIINDAEFHHNFEKVS